MFPFNYNKQNNLNLFIIYRIECRNSKKSLKTEQFFGNLESEVFCIKFDDEDTMVAAATTDGTISVYSLINGNHIKDLAGSDTYTPTTCLKYIKYYKYKKILSLILQYK